MNRNHLEYRPYTCSAASTVRTPRCASASASISTFVAESSFGVASYAASLLMEEEDFFSSLCDMAVGRHERQPGYEEEGGGRWVRLKNISGSLACLYTSSCQLVPRQNKIERER